MFDDIFNKNNAGRVVDSAVDAVLQTQNPGKPDFTQFMQRVGQSDLSRPNMFLVRFTDISSTIKGDGVISRSVEQNVDLLLGFAGDQIIDTGRTVILNSSIGQKALGAIDPAVIKNIIPGQALDGIIPDGSDLNKDIALLAKAVSAPGTSFDSAKTYQDRHPTPIVKSRSYDNIKITFYLTPTQVERTVFLAWMDKVHNPRTNTYGMYEEYAQDIEVYSLDRKGEPRGFTKCIGCFPISVSGIDFDVDSNNSVMTFDVEFTVSRMVSQRFNSNPIINQGATIVGEVVESRFSNIF